MRRGVLVGVSSIFVLSMFALFVSTAMAGDVPEIDTGDNAWMLMSAALVLFMTPGLALFYGGMVRSKNMVNTIWMSFICMCIATMTWVLWGYSLAFAPGNWFIGGLQWCGLGLGAVGQTPLEGSTIPHLTFMVFQGMFVIITTAIMSGAFVERFKFNAWMLLILLWTTIVYPPIAYWVWADGWLGAIGKLDFAGGTVVHICSGASALAILLVVGKRKEVRPPHNLPLMMLGTGMLWFGWFGFNAGSAGAADGLAASAFVVTNISAAAGGLAWSILEWIYHKKPTILGACSGVVAGLVGITPCAGYVGPMASIFVGVIAGIICFYCVTKLKPIIGYDDALDVLGIHAYGGTWGGLAVGIFASTSVNPGGADGAIYGNFTQLGIQAIGVLVGWAWAFGITLPLALFVNWVIGLRPSEADETIGMDQTQHKEISYHIFEAEQT
ncbi:MAG: ammonium transporter [Candidatus Loosdrechtia sp.]|uniref:ammonium transporter n=1 Tax=Candidatus Loosdrechtia sp. TaxID=3101272 RepID=UPI003A7A5E0B|nr:MAG: ammonium transporter [Candidatus Jettenia sp. AMX2]